jgi:hypothetical protein
MQCSLFSPRECARLTVKWRDSAGADHETTVDVRLDEVLAVAINGTMIDPACYRVLTETERRHGVLVPDAAPPLLQQALHHALSAPTCLCKACGCALPIRLDYTERVDLHEAEPAVRQLTLSFLAPKALAAMLHGVDVDLLIQPRRPRTSPG